MRRTACKIRRDETVMFAKNIIGLVIGMGWRSTDRNGNAARRLFNGLFIEPDVFHAQPLKMLLTIRVRPFTYDCRHVPSRL